MALPLIYLHNRKQYYVLLVFRVLLIMFKIINKESFLPSDELDQHFIIFNIIQTPLMTESFQYLKAQKHMLLVVKCSFLLDSCW